MHEKLCTVIFIMDILITLFYILFSICVVYPPAEFVSAGFTIAQLFDSWLGSENTNFIRYHMRRTSITILIHSLLPAGYIATLWCGGVRGEWMQSAAAAVLVIPCIVGLKVVGWWQLDRSQHPVAKALIPYVQPGNDWRVMASNFNVEYASVDKVLITLSATSKLVVTYSFIVKVTQYGINLVKQRDCSLVATATDSHALSTSGEDEVQYVNVEVIPSREDIKKFTFRISTTSLRDLQPRLDRGIRVPENILLLPTLIERFIDVFKQHVEQNPVYPIDEEVDLCIGCMQNPADVKLDRCCVPPPIEIQGGHPPCQQCNCRVLWCVSCMARWWAARARGPAAGWLAARGSCPVCRAPFCLRDVRPARRAPS